MIQSRLHTPTGYMCFQSPHVIQNTKHYTHIHVHAHTCKRNVWCWYVFFYATQGSLLASWLHVFIMYMLHVCVQVICDYIGMHVYAYMCLNGYKVGGLLWMHSCGSPQSNVDSLTVQIGSYYGSEIAPVDIDGDGVTDNLLVAAPMFFSGGWERGKVYIYRVTEQVNVYQRVL